MRRTTLNIALFLLGIISWGQKANISPEDASYNFQMYPQTLYYLQWADQSDKYLYAQHNHIIIKSASDPQNTIQISPEQLIEHYPNLRYIPQIAYADASTLVFNNENTYSTYNYLTQQKQSEIIVDPQGQNQEFNPLKKAVAYTIDNNLYLATEQNSRIPITSFSDPNIVAGQSIHRSEFGINKGIFWSPKANFIAFYQKDETHVSSYPLVDISSTPASLQNIKYPMAGQKSEQAQIGIFDLNTQKTIYLDIDTSDEHYLTNLSWSPDETFVLVAEVNRQQNQYWLNLYEVSSGKKVRTILTEQSPQWVEPEHHAVFLPNAKQFLWLSEKDGYMNLYLYDTQGRFIKQLTHFKWVVQKILGFDSEGKNVIISGTGSDPRQQHAFKVNLRTGKYTAITTQEGSHNVQLSSDGRFLISEFSNVQVANNIGIINLKDNSTSQIFNAPNPFENVNVGSIELLKIKADDGTTDLYAKMIKPHNFDPNKKYPVLVYVYGGPHAQLVTNSWNASTDPWMLAMASYHNYIIFTLDNRGSSNRGFSFERVIHRNLATYAVQDQMTGVRYLNTLPYIDSERMAVYGWSFGGFLASSLMLRHPQVFTTAVIGGAVTDWKYYEVMYGERYMDTPQENPSGYEETKVMNYLGNLKGKLLCIHGYLDDVVVPQHVLELSQESIKQGKNIDTFFYPKHKHNVSGADRKHLVKIITEYITEHNQ